VINYKLSYNLRYCNDLFAQPNMLLSTNKMCSNCDCSNGAHDDQWAVHGRCAYKWAYRYCLLFAL